MVHSSFTPDPDLGGGFYVLPDEGDTARILADPAHARPDGTLSLDGWSAFTADIARHRAALAAAEGWPGPDVGGSFAAAIDRDWETDDDLEYAYSGALDNDGWELAKRRHPAGRAVAA